ncbi:O-antigen ligase family protein [Pelagicoccus sp. NFK12]|uniref:O-antigen ligase family protein n=1 Tax=Pelagicoccus enzymogenes TaxID=2773457 RepID=A0A927FB60_9BACT|nr:O-antigen ligase family protein [Pelagicoccus enzymogenes]MBD5781189.1 O-antigen ligase family protein [Pelagicoccus enzymogenes]
MEDNSSEPASKFSFGGWLLGGMVAYGMFGQLAAVLASAGLGVSSRLVTVPSRALLLGMALASLIVLLFRPGRAVLSSALIAYGLFWLAFGSRILMEAATRVDVVVETGRFTLQFIVTMTLGGVLIPSLAVILNGCWEKHRFIRNTSFFLALGSGITTVIFYGNRFTNFENRMSAGDTEGGVQTINSIPIGYLGASLVIFAAYYVVCLRQRGFWRWIPTIVAGGLGLFLLVGSASRGPILGAAVTLLFFFAAQARRLDFRGVSFLLVGGIVGVTGLVMLAQFTGSAVINRIMGIGYAVATNSEGAARVNLYEMAAEEIAASPIVGSSLTLRADDGTDMYPHNLFIESMLATGLAGTIPLTYVLFYAFKCAWTILLNRAELGWVSLLFMLYFMYQMVGGAIYSSGQFWIGTATVISCGTWIRRNNYELPD